MYFYNARVRSFSKKKIKSQQKNSTQPTSIKLNQKGVRENHSHIKLHSLRSLRSRLKALLLSLKHINRKSSGTPSEQDTNYK